LGRCQPLQHDREGHADVVVAGDDVGRIGEVGGDVERPLRSVLAAGAPRAQLVQAQATHDHDEPSPNVVDLVNVDAEEPDERLLHDVLGFADAPEHAEGDVEQVAAVSLPEVRQAGVGDLIHTGEDDAAASNVTAAPCHNSGRYAVLDGYATRHRLRTGCRSARPAQDLSRWRRGREG